MKSMSNGNSDVVDILLSYRELSKTELNHAELLKDRTIVLYTATLLENKNLEVINLCLDIMDNLITNERNHPALLSTFGFFESLESLAISSRTFDKNISDRASKLVETLRNSAPPAYGTRLRTNQKRYGKRTTMMYHLYIAELTPISRFILDETLVSIKGMISFVVDVQQQRCTIRVGPKLNVSTVVFKILEGTGMKATVITKDKGKEKYVDVLEEHNLTRPLDYIADDETPPRNNAIYYFTNNLAKNAGGILKSAADFWNKSFYW